MEIDHNYRESHMNEDKSLPDRNSRAFVIGDRIKISDKNNEKNIRIGTLKYLGPVDSHDGIWAGIDLDEAIGKHDGQVNGTRYFNCRPNHGLFIKSSLLEHFNSHHENMSFIQTPEFKIMSSIGKRRPLLLLPSESLLDSNAIPRSHLPLSTSRDFDNKSDGGSVLDALSEELSQNQKGIYEGRVLIDKLRLQISQRIKSKPKTDDELNELNSLVIYLGDGIKNYERSLGRYERRLQKVINDVRLPHIEKVDNSLSQENDRLKLEVSGLQKQIAELLSEKVKFLDKMDSLEQSSQMANNHLITLKSEIRMHIEEINYHKKQYNSQKQIIENRDAEISQLKAQVTKLRIEYIDIPLKELNDAKNELDISNNDVKVLNQKLQQQNNLFSSQIKDLENLVKEKENIINEIKQSKVNLDLEHNKTLTMLESSYANNLELKRILEIKQNEYDEMENSLFQVLNEKLVPNSHDENKSAMNRLCEFLNSSRQNYIDSKSKLEQVLDAHKRQTLYFEDQVEKLNSRLKELSHERNEIRRELDSMIIKFDDLNRENQILRKSLKDSNSSFEQKTKELEHLQSQFNDILAIEERDMEYRKTIEGLENQIKELENQVIIRNNDIELLHEEFDVKFNKVLEDIKAKNTEHENTINELRRKCKQFQAKYESQLNQVAKDKTEHVEEIKTIQEEFLIITEEKNKILEQMNLMNQREKELNDIIDELQHEITYLSEHYKESKMQKILHKEKRSNPDDDKDHQKTEQSEKQIKDSSHNSSVVQYISELIRKVNNFKQKSLSVELDVIEGLQKRYDLINEQLKDMCLNKNKMSNYLNKVH